MTVKEVRIELIKKDKTAKWLASQLGYSTTYMYYCLNMKVEKEVKRIKEILEKI